MHKVQVWHDGNEPWHLESLRLQREDATPIFFDVQEELQSKAVTERSSTVTQGQTTYMISCKGMETRSSPMINIIGSKGQTRFRPFDPSKESSIKAISIGEISELQLKFNNDVGEWVLDQVEVATKVDKL